MTHHELPEPGQDSHNTERSLISILFVDDEPAILEAVRIYLEESGKCAVDTAESVSIALDKLHQHSYDAIIADYIMPDIDGIRFLQILRKEYGDIPFILYSWVDREQVLIDAINNGADFFLQKGGDPAPQFTELLHVIEQAVMRRRAEHALQESERRYRMIIEEIIDVYYRTDKEGNLIFVSPSALSMFGYDSLDELIGRSTVHFWKYPEKRDEMITLLKAHGELRDYEALILRNDGSSIPVSMSCRYYSDTDDGFAGVEGILRDISERKKTELELQDRNEELTAEKEKLSAALLELTETKDELAALNEELQEQQRTLHQSHTALQKANKQLNLLSSITRHDILNQIMALSGSLAILREECTDPDLHKYFTILESATRSIRAQIELTRVYQDLGTQEAQWTPLAWLISPLTVPERIRFIKDIGDIEVYSDPICSKVFENLMDNTIRHGQHATRVQVSARQTPEGLYIIWEDDGVGIADAEKEEIFERGYGKNTGLGLFLVREILSITGIGIKENGTPGKGARFEILVPPDGWRNKDDT